MSHDFSHKTTGELENIIANHRRAGKVDTDYFADALNALNARRHKGFDLQTTLTFLVDAASRREYVSYKSVAIANQLNWPKARRPINAHLDLVCEYAFRRNLPLLTAIVVNAEGVRDGSMQPEARAGFVATARRLGLSADDEDAFVYAEQQRVFDRFAGAMP